MKVKLDTGVLDKFAANLGVSTDRAMAAIAHQVEGEAAHRAPLDTGALRNSIHVEKKGDAWYWVSDGVEYGIFQELGTSKMKTPHPFMVPATQAVGREVRKIVRQILFIEGLAAGGGIGGSDDN